MSLLSKMTSWRQNSIITSWRLKVRHVKNTSCNQKHVMTSKRSYWHHNVLTSQSYTWRQEHVMTSTRSSWRQKVCRDKKVCYDVKPCVMTLKIFSLIWNIRWDPCSPLFKNILAPILHLMCRSRVINDYVYFTISVTLTMTYSSDISLQCRYHTRLPPYQVLQQLAHM